MTKKVTGKMMNGIELMNPGMKFKVISMSNNTPDTIKKMIETTASGYIKTFAGEADQYVVMYKTDEQYFDIKRELTINNVTFMERKFTSRIKQFLKDLFNEKGYTTNIPSMEQS